MSRDNVENWLMEKGWSYSGGWWLPPSGPIGHYKAKCYRFEKAVECEAGLRGMTVSDVWAFEGSRL